MAEVGADQRRFLALVFDFDSIYAFPAVPFGSKCDRTQNIPTDLIGDRYGKASISETIDRSVHPLSRPFGGLQDHRFFDDLVRGDLQIFLHGVPQLISNLTRL